MITANEIRKKSERKYGEVLRAALKGEDLFPLVIRSDKKLSRNFAQMSQEIAEVFKAAKDRKGFGYSVITERVNTRQHGPQDIPQSIQFDGLTDYLKFLNKEGEHRLLMANYGLIRAELPELDEWLLQHPQVIIANAGNWPDLLAVCRWFRDHFEPGKYYIRELPIPVHTKFVEDNKTVLMALLDEILPSEFITGDRVFEKRYGLKYDQPLIRFRALDANCWEHNDYDDLTVPLDQFSRRSVSFSRVFIVENKMNFLTFPPAPHAMVIWGKGFAVEALKSIPWLAEKEIYYWSDLDVQGFQMLAQLRSCFSQTKSFLMEREILEQYQHFIVQGTSSTAVLTGHLTEQENEVYEYLLNHNYRLEQERIHQSLVGQYLKQLF